MTPEAVSHYIERSKVRTSSELPVSLERLLGEKGTELANVLGRIEAEIKDRKVLFQENFDARGRLVRVKVGLFSGEEEKTMLWGVDLMKGKTIIYFGRENIEVGARLDNIGGRTAEPNSSKYIFEFGKGSDRRGNPICKAAIRLFGDCNAVHLEEVRVSEKGPLFYSRAFQAEKSTRRNFFI